MEYSCTLQKPRGYYLLPDSGCTIPRIIGYPSQSDNFLSSIIELLISGQFAEFPTVHAVEICLPRFSSAKQFSRFPLLRVQRVKDIWTYWNFVTKFPVVYDLSIYCLYSIDPSISSKQIYDGICESRAFPLNINYDTRRVNRYRKLGFLSRLFIVATRLSTICHV